MSQEQPILFSTPMVKALLAGQKTQTRRVIKPQPPEMGERWTISNPYGMSNYWMFSAEKEEVKIKCPYGTRNDVLWVRETHAGDRWAGWVYKADHPDADLMMGDLDDGELQIREWTPSIHMPKDACRLWLRVKSIRAERVADISEEDAIKEGIEWKIKYPEDYPDLKYYRDYLFKDRFAAGIMWGPKQSFRSLWNSINGAPSPVQTKVDGKLVTIGYVCYPFDEVSGLKYSGKNTWRGKPLTVICNPWVWVIKFKKEA